MLRLERLRLGKDSTSVSVSDSTSIGDGGRIVRHRNLAPDFFPIFFPPLAGHIQY